MAMETPKTQHFQTLCTWNRKMFRGAPKPWQVALAPLWGHPIGGYGRYGVVHGFPDIFPSASALSMTTPLSLGPVNFWICARKISSTKSGGLGEVGRSIWMRQEYWKSTTIMQKGYKK